ncbi:hypothetical protein SEA_GRAVAILLIA_71 [Mycobacterium phage Gravaillia]|nr:hypothetical protein SEA_GRAVAILLIA_71 [Mycobacterium phage Gravaillia]
MRIVRYPLDVVDYQQVQPLWPGRILSVAPGRVEDAEAYKQHIDMWAVDDDPNRGDRLPPILGVWIVGTGNPIPAALIENDAMFHGTCVMKSGLVWHVFTAVIGHAENPKAEPAPAYSSVDDMVERIRARRGRPGIGE